METIEGENASVEPTEEKEPVVATYLVRITLRGRDDAPTIREVEDDISSGLAWNGPATVSAERVDQ